MGIPVSDHVIVGGEDYYSFRENNLLFSPAESMEIVAEQGRQYQADRTSRR